MLLKDISTELFAGNMSNWEWYEKSADEVNKRYLEYLGLNKTFSHQGSRATVRRFANIVRPVYEAHKVELEEQGVENPEIEISNHFYEILEEANEGVTQDIWDKIPEDDPAKGRTRRSQGRAKNLGTMYTYLLVYNLAENLLGTDAAVSLHMPKTLREATTLKRTYAGEDITIPIEGDLVVFNPNNYDDPTIFISCKYSMKERSHIVTMWALLSDIAQDDQQRGEYNISVDDPHGLIDNLIYTFATPDHNEDLISPRNLIKMDASFIDYVFSSRPEATDAPSTVDIGSEQITHSASALYDLIAKRYDSVDYEDFGQADIELEDDRVTLGDFA